MKILKKKKMFRRLGFFFSNLEKSHLNPIGKGAEFRPLRHQKIPESTCINSIYAVSLLETLLVIHFMINNS